MRTLTLLLLSLAFLGGGRAAAQIDVKLDSNVALYEGEKLNFIFYPPDGFIMIDDPAVSDGYSFGFIPSGETYPDASLFIGVNIFKIRGMSFTTALAADTAQVHAHYGKHTVLWPIDSVFIATGETISTFFINDTTGFIPSVMMSYYNGGSEMVIFELVIADGTARFKAEEIYIRCLERFKVLPIGELGYE